MEVDCEGCAGCCLDWREVAPADVDLDHERRGSLVPLDDAYDLVPLTSDEVRAFLEAGLGDAMTPRLFASEGERSEPSEESSGEERSRDVTGGSVSNSRAVNEVNRETSDEPRDRGVTVDGHTLAAVAGRPAFFVGLRKPPKPVAPLDTEPSWLPSCVFLDPGTPGWE